MVLDPVKGAHILQNIKDLIAERGTIRRNMIITIQIETVIELHQGKFRLCNIHIDHKITIMREIIEDSCKALARVIECKTTMIIEMITDINPQGIISKLFSSINIYEQSIWKKSSWSRLSRSIYP